MSDVVTLQLSSLDVGQLLDALSDRAEAWEKTAALLNGEFSSEEFFLAEECSDPAEAEKIAQHFRDIIACVRSQLNT